MFERDVNSTPFRCSQILGSWCSSASVVPPLPSFEKPRSPRSARESPTNQSAPANPTAAAGYAPGPLKLLEKHWDWEQFIVALIKKHQYDICNHLHICSFLAVSGIHLSAKELGSPEAIAPTHSATSAWALQQSCSGWERSARLPVFLDPSLEERSPTRTSSKACPKKSTKIPTKRQAHRNTNQQLYQINGSPQHTLPDPTELNARIHCIRICVIMCN